VSMRAEVASSIALLAPAMFAATRAPYHAIAAVHATAICVSALLSIVYWSTIEPGMRNGDAGALSFDRSAARLRIAADVAALSVALVRSPGKSMLPLGLALLALGFYHASAGTGDARLKSLQHTAWHVIGVFAELALIGVAYA
jgi:hypothetical protein